MKQLTLLFEGWQVWDGQYLGMCVGGSLKATVEFTLKTELVRIPPQRSSVVSKIDGALYAVTARAAHVSDFIVLDLGSFVAISWATPGGRSRFVEGDWYQTELILGFNGWPHGDWVKVARENFGAEHTWLPRSIICDDAGSLRPLRELSLDTVSSTAVCYVNCDLVRKSVT